MKNNISSAEDLRTIRKMMEESTKFFSLSGLSGVFLGLFAIAGALVAWLILERGNISLADYLNNLSSEKAAAIRWKMALNALSVLVLSVLTGVYFSWRNAKRSGKGLLTPASRRLLFNLSIPLASGGIFAVILESQGFVQLIIPVFLIFYGIALINAGKFTYSEIFYLGISEIIIGLISAVFPEQGLIFWILGFGILHIVYGVMMYRKYRV